MNLTVQFSKQFGPLVVMTLAIFSSAGAQAQGTPLAVELCLWVKIWGYALVRL